MAATRPHPLRKTAVAMFGFRKKLDGKWREQLMSFKNLILIKIPGLHALTHLARIFIAQHVQICSELSAVCAPPLDSLQSAWEAGSLQAGEAGPADLPRTALGRPGSRSARPHSRAAPTAAVSREVNFGAEKQKQYPAWNMNRKETSWTISIVHSRKESCQHARSLEIYCQR